MTPKKSDKSSKKLKINYFTIFTSLFVKRLYAVAVCVCVFVHDPLPPAQGPPPHV